VSIAAVVDPVTFQEFYKCWKQNEVHVNQVASLNDFIDPCVEVVIKVSQLISCSFGTGHIVLTHDRQVALAISLSLLISVVALPSSITVVPLGGYSLTSVSRMQRLISYDILRTGDMTYSR